MRDRLVLGGVLAAMGGLVLWLSRSPAMELAHTPAPPRAPDVGPRPAPAEPVIRERVALDPRPVPPASLRGRVVTFTGAPLTGSEVRLTHAGQAVARSRTDGAGRFEFPGPLRAGTVVAITTGNDLVIEPESLELDELPAEEIVFVAREQPAPSAMGFIRGRVVHELDGSPVPFAALTAGGEALETDAGGNFVTSELHAAGNLAFHVQPKGWGIQVPFDPAQTEPLLVPARVGPTIYVRIEGAAGRVGAAWNPEPLAPGCPALTLNGEQCYLRASDPAFVRLPARERPMTPAGNLVLWSPADSVAGSVELFPGAGTRDEPLRIELTKCALLQVAVENGGRQLEWFEAVQLVLSPARDGRALVDAGSFFAVFQPGDYLLEARLDELLLAAEPVHVVLGKPQWISMAVHVPEDERVAEAGVERAPVEGRLTSRGNRATPGTIRLTRASDGEAAALDLQWAKADGRWLATFAGEAPRGELGVQLDFEPPYSWSGPRTLELPRSEELRYVLNDDVPLVDVVLEPLSAEEGAPVLAYNAMLVLDHGDVLAGEDFGSPRLAVAEDHPSDVPFTWLCVSAGRQAASGRYEGRTEGGEVRIPVSLARGWGAFLYVGGANREPLAGAEVLLDGVRRATTGTCGFAALACEVRPNAITVRYRDWLLWDGRVEADGRFDDSEFCLNAFFEPPGR